MPVKFALTCAQCDAPLPPLTQQRGVFTCAHCGATTAFALTASEFALFTDGLHAEEKQQGTFLLTGLEQTLAAKMDALTQQVERSLRASERLHLPQLEEALRTLRAEMGAIIETYTVKTGEVLRERRHAASLRNGRLLVAAVCLVAGLVGGTAWPVLLAGGITILTWIAWAGRASALATLQRELDGAFAPEQEQMTRRIAEIEQMVEKIRREHGPTRPASQPVYGAIRNPR